jgi:hypothetical protein
MKTNPPHHPCRGEIVTTLLLFLLVVFAIAAAIPYLVKARFTGHFDVPIHLTVVDDKTGATLSDATVTYNLGNGRTTREYGETGAIGELRFDVLMPARGKVDGPATARVQRDIMIVEKPG